MKKLLVAAVVFGTIGFLNGQEITTPQYQAEVGSTPVQQGNWMVGGSIGSAGYSFEGEEFNLVLAPKAGYFIADGVAIGLETKVGVVAGSDRKPGWQYGVMPFARYYFPEGASSTGRFFGEGKIGFAGDAYEGESVNSFAFGINAGYAHFISQTVALEGTVGYNYSKANVSGADAQSGLGFALGFQIYLPGGSNR
ncbi:MAG: hypothetical protein GX159_12120 [Flavobacteriaceae bacterium]|jgi:hypothetical protein|nr:hypothetical protein [Flavobacteriaceae bacterium]